MKTRARKFDKLHLDHPFNKGRTILHPITIGGTVVGEKWGKQEE